MSFWDISPTGPQAPLHTSRGARPCALTREGLAENEPQQKAKETQLFCVIIPENCTEKSQGTNKGQEFEASDIQRKFTFEYR